MVLRGMDCPWHRGDKATDGAKRQRAVKMFKIDECEKCDDKAIDRHHIDGDTGNNVRENLLFLCRRCHMEIDGRLKKLHHTPPVLPPKRCSVCDELAKPLRKGVCHRCNEWHRRNGKPRPRFVGKSRTVTPKDLAIIVKLRNKGVSYDNIRAYVTMSPMTIRRVWLEHEEAHKDIS